MPVAIPMELQTLAHSIAAEFALSTQLVDRLIAQESSWNPNAVNPYSKCTGLMQLHPRFFDGDLCDPAHNLRTGMRYLSNLCKLYEEDMFRALAAWNWGPGNLKECIEENGYLWPLFLPAETKKFVFIVLLRD